MGRAATSGLYAPYLVARYVEWLARANALRVSFLASFLGDDHGQVHMFEVDLTCAP
jgi:hypothetical protein